MNFKKKTLPNGLRIITVPTKGNPSVTVMVLVETGSNYEKKSENGLSHFLEHMMFKGTPTRPSHKIIHRELDGMGAQGNAFTGDEYTGYYAKAEKKQWKRALDLIADMYQNPLIPENELDKERGVILQEIDMYEDLPQRLVSDVLDELLFGDTPAGRTILGTKENLKKLKREDFLEYHRNHYVAKKTIVVVVGDVDDNKVVSEVGKQFKEISKGKKVDKPSVKIDQKKPAIRIRKRKTNQTHIILAVHALNARDKKTHILDLMATVLGKGFSSRLFEKLRDEMGACYYVKSNNRNYTDHGHLAVSAGIESHRAEEVVRTILGEFTRLKEELVTEEELIKAKDYLVGNMYLHLETSDDLAGFYGMNEIVAGKLETPQEEEKKIRSVTAKQIQSLAREIFQNKNLNLAIVGDIKDEKPLKKALKI